MDLTRIHRLLRLVTLLQSGTTLAAVDLGERLGVSKRTLFRDLATLEKAGIPYTHDPAHGYRIDEGFFLPPVNLKVNEALGLLLLAKTAEAQRDQPFFKSAVEAIQKLIATLPVAYKQVTCDMLHRVTIQPGATNAAPQNPDYFVTLQRAIDEKRICRICYHSLFNGEGDINTELHPYHLHFAVRAWYVIGRSSLHNDVRTFKLARIQNLELTHHRYKLDKPFHVEKYLKNAWSLIPESPEYKIELEFTSKVGQNVAEVLWHSTQQTKLLPDGRCEMQFTTSGLTEITWWLLGYGDQVIVKKPAELRKKLAEVYKSALKQCRA
ncbi:MAG: helix-turn-helix transcriptional regulator [Phycisphaerales bacterium]